MFVFSSVVEEVLEFFDFFVLEQLAPVSARTKESVRMKKLLFINDNSFRAEIFWNRSTLDQDKWTKDRRNAEHYYATSA